jgi:hypothetical protein
MVLTQHLALLHRLEVEPVKSMDLSVVQVEAHTSKTLELPVLQTKVLQVHDYTQPLLVEVEVEEVLVKLVSKQPSTSREETAETALLL